MRVRLTKSCRIVRGLQFGVEAAIEKHEESETCCLNGVALSHPRVRFCTGRIIKPVACVVESPAEFAEIAVAGVVIAIKAQECGLGV